MPSNHTKPFTKSDREATVSWLKGNQSNGAFEGQAEEHMDFESMPHDEIKWYYEHWALEDEHFVEMQEEDND